jgi:hypothetical protein
MPDVQPAADPPPAEPKFYAAVLQTTGEFAVREFETLAALVTFLRELIDHDASVFCFAGTQLKITKPPFRYLLAPDGPQPLFTLPPAKELETDDTGYLGLDPIYFEEPPQIKVSSAGHVCVIGRIFFRR